MTEPARPLPFTTIQAGRGIAALLVVLFHATIAIADPEYWGEPVMGALFSFGHAGVPFFFVLSGFIILWVHEKDIGRPARVGAYLRRRAARIYPPYWAVSLFILAVYAAIPAIGAAHPVAPMRLILSFGLVGAPDMAILPVGWTLFHEILFYALFGILILDLRAGLIAFASWFGLCLIFPDAGYFSATVNLLFAIGLAAAWAIRRFRIPCPLLLFWGGILAFLAVAILERTLWQGAKAPALLYGVGAAMSLAGAVTLERERGWRAPGALVLLGDSSYALYLVHDPIISAMAKVILPLPKEAAFVAIVGACVAGGFVFHFLFERPTLALLQRRPRRIRAPSPLGFGGGGRYKRGLQPLMPGEIRMSEVTAVPIRPLARGTLLKLWLAIILLCVAGAALAWVGTRSQQVQTLTSGAQLRTLASGNGPKITPADAFALRYKLHVGNLDAPVIQDSDETGGPFVATTSDVYPGFTDALQQMQAGGRYLLWLPPGTHQTGPIPAGAPFQASDTLVFEIQVLQIGAGQASALQMQRMQQMMMQQQQQQQSGAAGPGGAGAPPAGAESGGGRAPPPAGNPPARPGGR